MHKGAVHRGAEVVALAEEKTPWPHLEETRTYALLDATSVQLWTVQAPARSVVTASALH